MPFDAVALLDQAAGVLPDVVELRRRIHRHPELGLRLPKTQQAVLEALSDLPLSVRTGTALTSVVADLTGERGEGPTILLRGDMDALPMPEDTGLDYASTVDGTMHACGHDAHTAMLAGAARVLTSRRADFAGTIRFMFQPGEEGFHGARFMIEEGVLDDPRVDAVFGLHVTPNAPSGTISSRGGPIMAAPDVLDIRVCGKGGHASSPYLANDPMPVAAEIVTALQVFATRRIDTFDPVVITITSMHAGTTSNVIPEAVVMQGTLRSVSERSRRKALHGIERLVKNIAAAHEMEGTFAHEEGYPVTVNDLAFVGFTERVTKRLLGEQAYVEMAAPVMGAEDFSYLLQQRQGAFAFLGVCPSGDKPASAHACHSNRMTIDESALRDGVGMYCATALSFLDGELG